MKYFFFGQEKESGTTSNMLSLATRLAMKYKKKIILLQFQGKEISLETAFYKNQQHLRLQESCQYFYAEGFDFLQKKEEIEESAIEKSLRELIPNFLYYFPMGEREVPFLELQQYQKVLCQLVEKLEKIGDDIFIDCGTAGIRMFHFMKKRNDLCVVNFKQCESAFQSFFVEQYDTTSRLYYLVGNYHADSIWNKENLKRIYRIPEGQVGIVPYNPQFQYVCQRGQLGRYLSDASVFFEMERDSLFRKEMDKILIEMGQEERKEEQKDDSFESGNG